MLPADPEISVVIPVYNEENILETATIALLERIALFERSFELLLCENGSSDHSAEIVDAIATRESRVRALHSSEPDYGLALRSGILAARGRVVFCDEIDLGDMDFYRRALERLDLGAELVIGSKRHPLSHDNRPWLRRQGTVAINTMLRHSLGFRGSDTHGLKAFVRQPMLPIVQACLLRKDLFASELVIRAQRARLRVEELPLELREIRPPSIGMLRRVPRVLRDLVHLVYILRVKELVKKDN